MTVVLESWKAKTSNIEEKAGEHSQERKHRWKEKSSRSKRRIKLLNTSLIELENRPSVTLVNEMDEDEIHLEKLKKKVEGEG